jgi:hypothetical protein
MKAPGVNNIMAHSLNGTIMPFSGTSIATAHTDNKHNKKSFN